MTTTPHPPRRGRLSGDDGVVTAELLCWILAALILFGLATYTIRATSAAIDVAGTADAAARAASLAPTPAAAVTAAKSVADGDITGSGGGCHRPQVAVDTSRFRPGGQVTVTVTCTVTISDLPALGPVQHRVTGVGTAPIDTYRQVTP